MTTVQPLRIKTITEYHRVMGLPKPEHPLISLISFSDIKRLSGDKPTSLVFDFYSIAMKRNFNQTLKFQYGQREYDFDEGVMFCMSPNQVFSVVADEEFVHTGWMLLVHPDFLWNTPLAKKIKQYEYFSYAVHEALHLSDREEIMVTGLMQNIAHEYRSNIDKFSQDVIIAQLELLLTYTERFFQRQFITRKIANHEILERLEEMLNACFASDALLRNGLPTVQQIAETLCVSPNYLSGLLKLLTGQSTQQHIHEKLIEKAKEKLSTTNLSVSEIAYALGFEHPQSFNKLFKTKTKLSPLAFRQSFNS